MYDSVLFVTQTLRFDFVNNSMVRNLRSINSKNIHINLFACESMNLSHILLSAPASSPNTDGIHIGSSNNIRISYTTISTGDDCISMVSGSQNIDISNVACGPGHGISIGSLGRGHNKEFVRDISVRNCSFTGTDNGVRIKTWAQSSYSLASNISFENIVMKNPRNPIVIDQNYCPNGKCKVQVITSTLTFLSILIDEFVRICWWEPGKLSSADQRRDIQEHSGDLRF